MDKKQISLFVGILLCVSQSFAQNISSQVLKMDPVAPFLSTYSMKFERAVSDRFTVQLGGSYTYQSATVFSSIDGILKGYSAISEIRMYLQKFKQDVPTGIYLGIYGKKEAYAFVINLGEKSADLLDVEALSSGLELGWQFKLFDSLPLVVDLYLGGGYMISEFSGKFAPEGKLIYFNQNGISPRFGVSLGLPL